MNWGERRQIRQLAEGDAVFVSMETDEAPSHIAALTILDPSTSSSFGFERYLETLGERIGLVPRFTWKLREVPLGLDRAYWVWDPDFDVSKHVQRVAAPAPGDRATLGRLAGLLHAQALDRSRALWESWWIEGIEGGRVAILMKIHHCLMDGQAGIGLSDQVKRDMMLKQFNTVALFDLVDQSAMNCAAGSVCTVNNASVAVSAFLGEVVLAAVSFLGKADALFDEPFDGLFTAFHGKTHSIFMAETGACVERIVDMSIDGILVVEDGGNTALGEPGGAFVQVGFAENGYLMFGCQLQCQGQACCTATDDEDVKAMMFGHVVVLLFVVVLFVACPTEMCPEMD